MKYNKLKKKNTWPVTQLPEEPKKNEFPPPLSFSSELPAASARDEPARRHHQVHGHGQEGDQQAAQAEGEEDRVRTAARGLRKDGTVAQERTDDKVLSLLKARWGTRKLWWLSLFFFVKIRKNTKNKVSSSTAERVCVFSWAVCLAHPSLVHKRRLFWVAFPPDYTM